MAPPNLIPPGARPKRPAISPELDVARIPPGARPKLPLEAPEMEAPDVIQEQHPDISGTERWMLNTVVTPEAARRFFEERGLQAVHLGDRAYAVKRPEEAEFRTVDPEGFDWGDFRDLLPYLLRMGGATKGAITLGAKGAGAGTAVGGPVGGVLGGFGGAAGGAAAGSALAEAGLQAMAKGAGFDPTLKEAAGAVGREAAWGAAGEAVLGPQGALGLGIRGAARGIRALRAGRQPGPAPSPGSVLSNLPERPPEPSLAKELAGEAEPPRIEEPEWAPPYETWTEPEPPVVPSPRPEPEPRPEFPEPRTYPEAPAKPEPSYVPDEFPEFPEKARKAGEAREAPTFTPADATKVPTASIGTDPERFQFRARTSKEGVKTPLEGEWRGTAAGNLLVWEDKAGKLWVVNGHHRLSHAKATGQASVNAHIIREAEGITEKDARAWGAMDNIIGEQGDIDDFARFFRNTQITEDAAKRAGLLRGPKGRTGFVLGRLAGESLYSNFQAGNLSAELARAIAEASGGHEGLQAAALKRIVGAKKPPSPEEIGAFVRALGTGGGRRAEIVQGDIFGFDDAAIREADAMSKVVAGMRHELGEQVRSVSGAVKRPGIAKKLGVDVNDPTAVAGKIEELKGQLARLDRWEVDRELVGEIRKRAQLEPIQAEMRLPPGKPPKAAPPATPVEQVAPAAETPPPEAPGQMDLFGAAPEPAPPPPAAKPAADPHDLVARLEERANSLREHLRGTTGDERRHMLTKLRSVEEQLERAERARDEAVSKAMGTYPGKPAPTVPPAEVGRHAAYPAAEKETVGGRVSRRLPELERLTAGSLDPKMQSGDPRRVKDLLDSFGEEEYLVTWTKRSTSKGGEFGELGTMRVGKPPARKHIDELGEALKEKTDDELREMLRAQGVTHRAGRTAEGKPYKEAIESLPRERLLIEIYKGQGAAISGAGEAYDPSKYLLRRVYSKTAEERGGKGPFWRHVPLNNVKQVIGPDGAVYRFGPAGEPVRMPVADPTPAKPTVPSPAGPPVKRPEPAPSTTPPPAKPAEKPAPTPPERVLVDTAGKEARFEQPIEPVWEAAKKPIPPRPEAPRRPPRPAREPIWAKIGREAPEPASAPAPHAEAPTPTWSPQKRGTPLYRAGLKLKMGSEKVEDIGRRVTELVPRAGYTILRRVLGRGHVSPVDSFAGGALGAATAFLGPSAALQTAAGVTGAGLGIQALGKAGKAVAYLMMTDRGRLMERAARSAPGRIAIKAKAALDALDKGNEARYRALVYLLARDRSFQDWFTGIEAEEQERDRQAG